MVIDLTAEAVRTAAHEAPWRDRARYWADTDAAVRHLSAPVVALNLAALAHNAFDMLRRAGGLPIRVASKSVRSRGVIDAVLALPGYRGVLAFTLAEALFLARDEPGRDGIDDVVVAYPTVDMAAIAELARDETLAARVTLMVDSVEHLDLIAAAAATHGGTAPAPIRVCIDFDASWRAPGLGHIGVRRSPVRTPEQAGWLARQIVDRPGFKLVGVMAYEAQIAGVGDKPKGNPAMGAMLRAVQRASAGELALRRADAVAAVRSEADIEFVNGGGTGSIERTVAESCVTEVAAGSGLYGPHLFDNYSVFDPAPALGFGLDVVRKPTDDRVTLLGGGYIASGPQGADRAPQPVWPAGLSYEAREGAGEVQTPLRGDAALTLAIGDRVWLRHTKAGELLEHALAVVPVIGDAVHGDELPTYRGEGKRFL